MADGDGWTSQLLAGLAQQLHTRSIGVWRPAGSYTTNEIAITIRDIPATPDRVITLASYVVVGERGVQDTTVGVQARIRGTRDPRVCEDIGDALYEFLDSSGRQTWGDIAIVDAYRQSYASLGHDGNGRWEASHNYYVEAMRCTPHRTD